MHPKFAAVIESLQEKFDKLLAGPTYNFVELPKRMPESGVYLFSEGSTHHYVGRSNDLRKRYLLHCRPGSQQNQATFAFKLAREAVGIREAAYKAGASSRAGLAADPDFQMAFSAAKERLRGMDFRYVEETDQTRQALLEAYCAIVLDTQRRNDFDTH
jgi:hypothetical protein